MTTNLYARLFAPISLLLILFGAGCGVEAGNPDTGDQPKTGKVSLNFARVFDIQGQSFKLALTGAELRSGNGAAAVTSSLNPATDSLELFGLTDDQSSVLAASSDTVPVGTYDHIYVKLNGKAPVSYTTDGGDARSIGFGSEGQSAFKVQQTVEVKEGETTDLVVSLDARRSLVHPDDDDDPNHLVFRPRGGAERRDHGLDYEGSVGATSGGAFVCAYLYAAITFSPPAEMHPDGDGDSDGPGNEPPKGPDLDPRPTYPTLDDVVKDTTDECPNAFDRTRVEADGSWRFHHVRPGTFDFRLFKTDGSFQDLAGGIVLTPPAHGEGGEGREPGGDHGGDDHGGHPPPPPPPEALE